MTIDLPQDLARLLEDAVRNGPYESELDVLRDALNRVQPAGAGTSTTTTVPPAGSTTPPGKALTKQALLRHLAAIGLVDDLPLTRIEEDAAEAPETRAEDEVISEVVIRERLIEWLVGFL